MRKGMLWAFGLFLFGNSPLFAQSLPSLIEPRPYLQTRSGSDVTSAPPLIDLAPDAGGGDCYRVWARGEYLLWWVKNAPMPVPLVTTTPEANLTVSPPFTNGALGGNGTQVLFGDNSVKFHSLSGMRGILGAWLDADNTIGIEGSAFLLPRVANTFIAKSDANGRPPLYFPAFSVFDGGERAVPISDPLNGFAGSVSIGSTLQLWGAELNGLFNVRRTATSSFNLIAGFRYMDLGETLNIHNSTTDLILLNTDVSNDNFNTRNQFYGGQVGARASYTWNRLTVDATGKIAIGSTHQVVDIQGNVTQTPLPGGFAPTPGTFPGFLYTQPSNIGQQSHNQFTCIPAVELKLAYRITDRLRATMGYDFMYWSSVVRPGNQIDHNVNISQSPVLGTTGGVLTGAAAPLPQFNRSDFFAHGVNVGLEFRY